jgi:hypothetical protein
MIDESDERRSPFFFSLLLHAPSHTTRHTTTPTTARRILFPFLLLFHISLCLTLLLDGYNPRRFDMDERKKRKEREREKTGSWEDREDENEEETGVERDIPLLLVNGLLEEGSLDLGGNRGRRRL